MKTLFPFSFLTLALVVLGVALPGRAQPVLSIDFNRRNADAAVNTAAGFSSFIISSNVAVAAIQSNATVRTFGALTVTIEGVGANVGYDDRLRTTPVDSGAFADGLLLRDFVFSRDNAGTDGLAVTVAGLMASKTYRVVIWSFDASSGGSRVSDWFANGTLVRENYTFDGRVLPASNDSYKFVFEATTDGAGQLLISARRKPSVDTAGAATFGVFLNALQILPAATPPIITAQPMGGARGPGDRITFNVSAEGEPPLVYTWFKDGVELPGPHTSTRTVSDITAGSAGSYTVQIANFVGTTTSDPAVLTFVPDPAPNVPQGLISYWPLDEIEVGPMSQVTTPDLYSRNDFTMVNMGFTEQTPGRFMDALMFDGATQHGVRVGGAPIYNNPSFTVSLWVNGTGTGQSDRRFFSESSTNGNNPLFNLGTQATGADGTIRVFIRNDAGTVIVNAHSTQVALDGTWHHVVWAENNGQARLYIDGVLDGGNFNYTRGPLTLNQTSLGAIVRAAVGSWCAAKVDEVAVWNRALTYTEVQSIGTVGVPPPVAALPPMITRQPTGASVFAGETVVLSADVSGTQPLAFQWRRDGADVEDATNSVLPLANIQTSQAGTYSLRVTNIAGMVVSSDAVVAVESVADIRSGLVAYWPLNALTDRTLDATTNGNDLLGFNLDGSNLAAGQFGDAVCFNGTDEIFARGVTNGFGLPIYHHGRYTVALWVKGQGIGQTDRRIFSEGSTVSGTPLLNIGTDNTGGSGAVDIFIRTDGNAAVVNHLHSTTAAFDDTWHHIAWVDDNGAARLYIDGVLDATSFAYTRGTLTLDTLSVGGIQRAAQSHWFTGCIDDVALWRRALTADEVTHVKNYGPNPPPPIHIGEITIVGDLVTLTFTVPNPGTFYCVQQTADIANPAWGDVPGAIVNGPNGNTFTAQFTRTAPDQRFYRVYNCP